MIWVDEEGGGPDLMYPLRVSDVRHWCYCPRVVYWRQVVPVPVPETHKMRVGREEEARLVDLEERRGLRRYGIGEGARKFDVWLRSQQLRLEGVVDMVIETPSGPAPVDYKMVRFIGEHHRLQLAGYALMLEELRRTRVERGFLYSLERDEIEVVEIDEALRTRFVDTLTAIREMMCAERMPDPTPAPSKCEECEYLRFCNDIL